MFDAIGTALVSHREVGLETPFALLPGLEATLSAVPGKVSLCLEGDEMITDEMSKQTAGVETGAGDRRLSHVPGRARMTAALADRLNGDAIVLFDGTLWTDDDLIVQGVGQKPGRGRGHMSMSGPDGLITALAGPGIRCKVFAHINNTNPVCRDGAERIVAAAADWEIGPDGMEVAL